MRVSACPLRWLRRATSVFFLQASPDTVGGRWQARELARRGSFPIRRSQQTPTERPPPPQRRAENIFLAIASPAGRARSLEESQAPPALESVGRNKGRIPRSQRRQYWSASLPKLLQIELAASVRCACATRESRPTEALVQPMRELVLGVGSDAFEVSTRHGERFHKRIISFATSALGLVSRGNAGPHGEAQLYERWRTALR